MPARSSSSIRSTTIPSTRPAYILATPVAETSWPSEASILSAGPLSARPPTIGLTATFGARGWARASLIAWQGQDRAYAHDRVRRTQDDGVGTGDRREHMLRRPGVLDTAQLDPEHLVPLPAAHEVLLELEAAFRGLEHRRDRIVAHRQHGALHAKSTG